MKVASSLVWRRPVLWRHPAGVAPAPRLVSVHLGGGSPVGCGHHAIAVIPLSFRAPEAITGGNRSWAWGHRQKGRTDGDGITRCRIAALWLPRF
jgi:hypothetical protein